MQLEQEYLNFYREMKRYLSILNLYIQEKLRAKWINKQLK